MSKPVRALAVAAVMSVAAVAPADILYKVSPGTECVAVSGSAAYTSDGAIFNTSSVNPLTVSCPVVRPYRNANAVSAQVEYLDASAGALSCSWRTEGLLTTTVVSETKTSSANDNFYREFTFTSRPDLDGGAIHYLCTLPAGNGQSYIVSYNAQWSI